MVKGMSGRRTRPGKQVGSGVNFIDGGGTKRRRGLDSVALARSRRARKRISHKDSM